MAGAKKHFELKDYLWSVLISIVLLSFYFVYFFWRIDAKLIYQSQEPVFFFDRYFWAEFFTYPGGFNELFARFLSQFFYYSWTGALLLVLILSLVVWNSKLLFRSISFSQPMLFLHWIPSVILLALHSDYRYPLVFSLGLLWVLLCVNLYIRLAPAKSTLRVLFYIVLYALLYYLAAGQALLLSIIIILYDMLYQRRILLPVIYAIFTVMLPYIGTFFFLVNVKDAYLSCLTFCGLYNVTWLSWMLYTFFPLALLLQKLGQKYLKNRAAKVNAVWAKLTHHRSQSIQLIQGFIFILFTLLACHIFFNKSRKTFLQIDYATRCGEWEKIIDMAKQGRSGRSVVECQTYRALYHAGRLCDELFSLTQHFGGDGLFMHPGLHRLFPLQHSDIFFDLGLFNEAEHWAYEAIAVKGETPPILQRLVLVNFVEGNQDVAARYLGMLEKTLWHRTWAAQYQKIFSDSSDALTFPQFQLLQRAMPEADFLVSPSRPERCLEELLKTKNKMAFEYYMSYCLLEGKIDQFVKQLSMLNDFHYPKIPRHFEEAMLIYFQLTGRKDIELPGKRISQQTIRQFVDFNQILAKYDKNASRAYQELKKYKNTYWFYALYYYHAREH
ncbi:hypothetical protein EH223_10520 [candidate division KSB1 bacterium]|nr:hypothetical protein [candidate division KSB1 bacterium]RQW03191.1 MAG: hypothetical protein EH223_10520 [candidate division KSB1 bacterium]